MEITTFFEGVLKGVGQVMFMGSPITGIFFLLGIAWSSRRLAAAALLGSSVGAAVGLILGAPEDMITFGLFGFNGVLCAEALYGVFTEATWGNLAYSSLAAGVSAVVFAALMNLLSAYDVPALTAPFVFTTWIFLFAAKEFKAIRWRRLDPPPEEGMDISEFLRAVLRGVGQVMFIDDWVTGLIFCAGLSLGTLYYNQFPYYLAGPVALMGSLSGTLAAYLLKAPKGQVRLGLFGFNSVLAALAVGGVFIDLSLPSLFWAVLAASISSILTAALMILLRPYGIPSLTAPFVFTTWIFLFGLKLFTFPS